KSFQYLELSIDYRQKYNEENYINDNQKLKLAESYLLFARVYQSLKDYDQTLVYNLKAFDIYHELEMSIEQADIYCRIAWFYMEEVYDYKKAVEYSNKALNLRKHEIPGLLARIPDEIDALEMEDILRIYGVIGFASYKHKNFKRALSSYKWLLEYWILFNNKNQIADHSNYIGRAYYEIGRFDSAYYYFNTALNISEENGFRSSEGQSHYNLGLLYRKEKFYDKSVYHLDKSLKIREELGRRQDAGYSMVRLAEVMEETGALESAAGFLLRVYDLAVMMEDEELEEIALQRLPGLYASMNDNWQAYYYQSQYNHFSDSVFKLRKSRELLELQARMDVESKEREIIRQKEEQILRTQQTAVLHGTITILVVLVIGSVIIIILQKRRERNKRQWLIAEQKALRSQMNPHFIYNSLTSLQGLVLTNQTEIANEFLTRFSRLLRKVLDNSKQGFILLDDEIESIELYLDIEKTRFEDKFSTEIIIDPRINSNGIVVPPLLIQPLAENAILHGITPLEGNKGLLRIELLESKNNILKCLIEDNGIGRERSAEINKQRISHTSAGMRNVQERLRLLGNQLQRNLLFKIIDLRDKEGNSKGTKIEFEMPFKLGTN
ncbi:MAG: histidine kinase, partial [Bacteroidales bacterium]|nr:histidine kinase [Bacteroidales bacterium]